MRRLASFLRLTARNQALFIVCVAALALVRVALNVVGYRRLERWTPVAGTARAPDSVIVRLAWLIPRAARLVPGATCLTQAAATRLLLALDGYGSELHVGAADTAARAFDAHAWLVCGGRIVVGGSEAELARYARFDLTGALGDSGRRSR